MKRLSPFMTSLVGEAVLLAIAMCMLDDGRIAITWGCACTLWNLILISDWVLCKSGYCRHEVWMRSFPGWLLLLVPLLFSLVVGSAVNYIM